MHKTAVASSTLVQPRSSRDPRRHPERTAALHIVSKEPQHPDTLAESEGWRASEPGPHTICVKFDKPTSIRRIHLEFCEPRLQRSQEFSLAAVVSGQRRHIVRQQWTFSPDGSTREIEDYAVNLASVTAIELHINPDRHNDQAFASVQTLAIA
jgi:hypothetical protein